MLKIEKESKKKRSKSWENILVVVVGKDLQDQVSLAINFMLSIEKTEVEAVLTEVEVAEEVINEKTLIY